MILIMTMKMTMATMIIMTDETSCGNDNGNEMKTEYENKGTNNDSNNE